MDGVYNDAQKKQKFFSGGDLLVTQIKKAQSKNTLSL